MESLQGGELIFPKATRCLFGRIQVGAWDFAVPGWCLGYFSVWRLPFPAKPHILGDEQNNLEQIWGLANENAGKKKEWEDMSTSLFRRSVLVKRNYIWRTRQIVSDLLSWRTAAKAKHFSVKIMITWQDLIFTMRNDPDIEKICSFTSSCCFLIAQFFLAALNINKNKTKGHVFT